MNYKQAESAVSSEREALLALLAEERGLSVDTGTDKLPRRKRVGRLPLSYAQRQLWFLDQLDPASVAYNITLRLRFRGELQVAALERSIADIVARHEALRTRFVAEDGRPYALVEPEVDTGLEFHDLSVCDDPNALEHLIEQEANSPFDLTKAPLMRSTLVRSEAASHTLIVAFHHIVCDGWSMGVLVRELRAFYSQHAHGHPVQLEPLRVQYPDYAVQQREQLQGERLEGLRRYWSEQLAAPPAQLQLPLDSPRPAKTDYAARSIEFEVHGPALAALEDLCESEATSLFSGILGAVALALQRYAGADDLVLGTPFANRDRSELEPLIGFFVNTLPLRITLAGQPTFREVLRRARETARGALAHQELPLERIVEAARPNRSAGHNPLFQVLLALQNAPREALELPGLKVESELLDRVSRFELEIHTWMEQERLRGRLLYQKALFSRQTMQRLAEHLEFALGRLALSPDDPVNSVCLLTPDERQALVGWSEGARVPEPPRRLHEVFQERARQAPHRIALRAGTTQLSYRELDELSNGLAQRLSKVGVAAESRVGVFCERGPGMWAAVLAILKIGAAYVPLDPDHPAPRRKFIWQQAGVHAILTSSKLVPELGEYPGPRLLVDVRPPHPVGPLPAAPVFRDSAFCILYTSGSTGTPKGVCLTHGLVEDTVRRYLSDESRQTLQFAPLAFDVSLEETFPTWWSGGTVVLVSDQVRRDVRALAELIGRHQVGKVILPVTWLQQLAEYATGTEHFALSEVVATGEQLQVSSSMRSWFGSLPGCRLRNVYGPTEAQVITDHVLPADPQGWPELPSIGKPLPNFSGYVLDSYLNLVPRGVQGELWARNETAARGYLKRADLTAERFLPCPFGPPASRMYRTGDQVRWCADGTLEFKGRKDHQVKIRGFRIELGEVEAQLLRCPGVRDALALTRPSAGGGIELIGVVTVQESFGGAAFLEQHLKAHLPDYMVPARLFVWDSFPLGSTGKVDRGAVLAKCALELSAGSRRELQAPSTETERTIARVWCDVLELASPGRTDHFFELGGHSLTATQVVVRLEQVLNRTIPVRLLFEHPVLKDLAAALDDSPREQSESPGEDQEREEFSI